MSDSVIGNSFHLGILGGGQLGRMFIQEAISYDVHVHILDNDPHAPCAQIANSFTLGDITDYDAVYAFGLDKDVITVEIENVNIQALYQLESEGVKVFPQPRVLELIKDKGIQKTFYRKKGIPTADFSLVDKPDANELRQHLPFVQKLRTGGYDGKGVQIVKDQNDLSKLFGDKSVLEELIPFEKELSVIVARNSSGETAVYPTVECEFNDANLVDFLFSPAEIDPQMERKAEDLAIQVINSLDMVGILAVEMFLTSNGELLVNEIAPRPHNSGHHTIECNITSQFEQHLRSILNLPLGSTKIIRAGAMLNLIGETGYSGPVIYEGFNEILKVEGLHPHIYGKSDTKANRKMGHITITGETMAEVRQKAELVRGSIRVIA